MRKANNVGITMNIVWTSQTPGSLESQTHFENCCLDNHLILGQSGWPSPRTTLKGHSHPFAFKSLYNFCSHV